MNLATGVRRVFVTTLCDEDAVGWFETSIGVIRELKCNLHYDVLIKPKPLDSSICFLPAQEANNTPSAVSSSGPETLNMKAFMSRCRDWKDFPKIWTHLEKRKKKREREIQSNRDQLPIQWLYWELCKLKSWISFLPDVLQRVTFGIKIKSISRWYCSCFKREDVQGHMSTIHLLTT